MPRRKIDATTRRRTDPHRPAHERFAEKWIEDPATGCWLWQGTVSNKGYGQFYNYDIKKPSLAHRWLYEQLHGALPLDVVLDHLCRTPACVNPEHLEPVTQQINMQRGFFGTKTHCPHGHEYSEENTYRSPSSGHRQCRTCIKARSLARNKP